MLNKGMAREVQSLQVYCPNASTGCDWVGEIGSVENHLDPGVVKSSARLCQFETVVCSNKGCGEEMLRRDLAKHQNTVCRYRLVECQFCESFRSTYDNVIDKHYLTCPAYPVDCPNGCGERNLPRGKLSEHLERCTHTLIDCDFKSVGCEFQRKREAMSGHLELNTNYHMKLICKAVSPQLEKFSELGREIESLTGQVATLQEENKETRKENSELRNLNNQLQSDVQSTRELINQLDEKLQKVLLSKSEREGDRLQKAVEKLEQSEGQRMKDVEERRKLAEQIFEIKKEKEQMKKEFEEKFGRMRKEADTQEATIKRLQNEMESQKDVVKTIQEDTQQEIIEAKLESLKLSIGEDIDKRVVEVAQDADNKVDVASTKMDQKMQGFKDELNQNIKNHEEKVTALDEDLKYVERWITPRPPFAFTVSRFQERKLHKEAFVSPPFYHDLRGYKMCVRVDVYGMNNHVAVFCCIMRGEHDGLLAWPFHGAIKIRLQNHLDDRHHFEKDIRFDANTDVKKSGRVKTGDKNYLHGHPQFIAHSKLAFDAEKNCQYLKGDALDFEVIEVKLLR